MPDTNTAPALDLVSTSSSVCCLLFLLPGLPDPPHLRQGNRRVTRPSPDLVERLPPHRDKTGNCCYKGRGIPVLMSPTPRYRSIGELGKGILRQIVRSPDGKTILVSDGITLRVLNSADNVEIGSLDFGTTYGEIYSFSPNSRYALVSKGFYSFS